MSAAASAGDAHAAAVHVRTALASDLDAIMALEHEAFPASPWHRSTMAEEVASEWGRYLVAERDGAVLGYAGLRAVGVEGDIQTIAVRADARGTGIGRRLLTESIAEARRRGVRELHLDVRVDNEAAIGLYRAFGFRQLGIRRGYYQPENVDAATMRLDLA